MWWNQRLDERQSSARSCWSRQPHAGRADHAGPVGGAAALMGLTEPALKAVAQGCNCLMRLWRWNRWPPRGSVWAGRCLCHQCQRNHRGARDAGGPFTGADGLSSVFPAGSAGQGERVCGHWLAIARTRAVRGCPLYAGASAQTPVPRRRDVQDAVRPIDALLARSGFPRCCCRPRGGDRPRPEWLYAWCRP